MNPQVNPTDANSIKASYQGYAAWNDPAAIVADFKATGGSGKGGPTAGGMSFNTPGSPPTFDLVGATNSAYNTPELQAAGQSITDANTELTTRQQALATAQAGINDNPFYSEATRVGKSQQLTQQANADMGIIQNKIVQAQNQQATLKADAAIKVNAALGQYNINNDAYKTTLSQFNNLLQAGALTNMGDADLAQVATQTGIPVAELKSIQQKQQDDNVKTTLVTSDNGTVSVVDTKTGKIISQTQPGIATTQKQTGGVAAGKANDAAITEQNITATYDMLNSRKGPQGYVSKEDWNAVKQKAIKAGMTPQEFNSNFGSFTNPEASKYGYVYN